jgi:hypothetical protein
MFSAIQPRQKLSLKYFCVPNSKFTPDKLKKCFCLPAGMDELEILESAGLSLNEAKIIISLAEHKQMSPTEISKASGISRPNVYLSLKKLCRKEIAGKCGRAYEIKNLKAISAGIKERGKNLSRIMPELLLAHSLSSGRENVKILEGVAAMRDTVDNFLKFKEPLAVFGIPKEAPEILGNWLVPHHQKRIKLGIPMMHLYNEDAKERIKLLNKLPFTKARYLPKEFNSPASTEVCGDETMIAIWRRPPVIIKIKNRAVAEAYKNYFKLLWRNAKND